MDMEAGSRLAVLRPERLVVLDDLAADERARLLGQLQSGGALEADEHVARRPGVLDARRRQRLEHERDAHRRADESREAERVAEQHEQSHAEDRAEIASRKEQVQVPFGYFKPGTVLMTRELNPLEPKTLEFKFYARGVGPLLAIGISGGSDREELVSYSRGK